VEPMRRNHMLAHWTRCPTRGGLFRHGRRYGVDRHRVSRCRRPRRAGTRQQPHQQKYRPSRNRKDSGQIRTHD
jgi:hypothetical protein